jgi:hypothetical protein
MPGESKRLPSRERRNEIGASTRVTFTGGGGFEYFAGSPNIVVQPMHAKNEVSYGLPSRRRTTTRSYSREPHVRHRK